MPHQDDPLEELFKKSGMRKSAEVGMNMSSKLGIFFIGLLVLIAFSLSFVGIYTDWLWYSQDLKMPIVFEKTWSTRIGLWLSGFAVAFMVLAFYINKAMSAAIVYMRIPETISERLIADVLNLIQRRGKIVGIIISFILAVLFAMAFSSRFQQFWWFQAATPFGKTDPLFHMDIGFYVFQLPWIQTILTFTMGLLLLCLVILAAAYYGLKALAVMARVELGVPFGISTLSLLGGLSIINYGAIMWCNRFDFGITPGLQFTGPGYAIYQQLQIHTVLAAATMILGIAIIINGYISKSFKIPMIGIPALFILGLIGEGIYPTLIQKLVVEPDKINVETPYAKNAIQMTRYAYGLDKIHARDFELKDEPTIPEVRGSKSTLENMRLWDPEVLKTAIDGLQTLQPYYSFPDVEIDRYNIEGKQRMVMVSPRNINTAGLPPSAQTWVPMRLQYTHGYGFVMSQVRSATAIGQPDFLVKDFEMKSHPDLIINQPRIYFSDFRDDDDDSTQAIDPYAIVGTKLDEFDYPTHMGEKKYRWTGGRGVSVGGLLSRLAYSIVLGDGNLLISTNITKDSRLLYRRNIYARAKSAFPMLKFDSDPYIVLYKGRLVWVMDAYTSTGHIPYSQHTFYQDKRVNYIRNSIKVAVDAYNGEVTGYSVDEKDPILQAYRKIFPGYIQPVNKVPSELKSHFRYPEDLFTVQATLSTVYHVQAPDRFINNEDVWAMPSVGSTGSEVLMTPYYVQMRLPDEPKDSFMLIMPFTPRRKFNMIGWMAAHCDPDRYGEVILYRFPKNNLTPGPNQMESNFNQDRAIADINRQLNNEQSKIVAGNLLVIPIGSSILYAKPLFLQSKVSQPIPELKKVILGLKGRVVVGDTYNEALNKLFGEGELSDLINNGAAKYSADSKSGGEKIPAQLAPHSQQKLQQKMAQPPQDIMDQLQNAMHLLDNADEALRKGDFAKYGELQKRAREKIRNLTKQTNIHTL